ncbi:MAG: fumarylacetoacetate hydrolase family protein [Blastocatellia bacterium]|nr:fumarylacetoacetate hydrolase family protein [Blastocatellia bacterium]MCS7156858.1 fumarylacetoacetate hydrolase family protein [Blastocatellia bacterium]MCX7752816.1 fumarylacetoacetate hydrolase family protein [Blastocatellia bacterium]MDW8167550.1 fumarylacetoacetate hydrolase family protein [Acidobacteriota bacterium]MDW8256150.1 fumarylacetoacetate hydrolase family protein [Acidobacteriota bacterium]
MQICRFLDRSSPNPHEARYGLVEGERVVPIKEDHPFGPITPDASAALPLERVRLLAPCTPSKIVALGRNYRDHAAELGHDVPTEPLIFFKPPSAVIGPEETIRLPAMSARVDYEGELVVVMGRRAYRLREDEDPLAYVLGYTCGNDVTARDLQRRDGQFARAKGFDTFAPIGPVIATTLDPANLRIETRVNGQVRQRARTSDLVFPVPMLIRFISQVMTLLPGDLIFTGTPAGVGPLADGDIVEVEIEGIGTLRNSVRAE